MVELEFSEWPGAWERHIIRRSRCPHLFFQSAPPTHKELAHAQLLDKTELTQLEVELAQLVSRCNDITESADIEAITQIKNDLDKCYDTACGVGAELNEQKEALTLLNEVITTAIRRTLREGDEHARLLLIKQESVRMRHLTRLNYTIVCDLLRAVNPIPENELAAAMLSETDEAFTVALEVLDQNRKQSLAAGIEDIIEQLGEKAKSLGIERKQDILKKTMVSNTDPVLSALEEETT